MNYKLKILNTTDFKELIYEIRNQKVMFDFDLAYIYGYETKTFNQQIKNNINRFDDDFRFQITKEEFDLLAKYNNNVAQKWATNKGGRTTLPYVFTEQGIYMLMTVLKGELAVQQSKALIRLFKAMKDYITSSGSLISVNPIIENKVYEHDKELKEIKDQLGVLMECFDNPSKYKHFILMNGERIESDIAYQKIYSLARKSIIVVDDYIGIKTLEHLKVCDKNIKITICSDNVARNNITQSYIEDFKDDTGIDIELKPTNNRVHDRYIVIDYGSNNESLFHSGASSKDAGSKLSTITKIEDIDIYRAFIDLLIM